jgi:hypothetical protein
MTRQFEDQGKFVKPWDSKSSIYWRQTYAAYDRVKYGVNEYYYKSRTWMGLILNS